MLFQTFFFFFFFFFFFTFRRRATYPLSILFSIRPHFPSLVISPAIYSFLKRINNPFKRKTKFIWYDTQIWNQCIYERQWFWWYSRTFKWSRNLPLHQILKHYINSVSFNKFMESIFRQLQDWNYYNNIKHTNIVNLPWYTSWWNTGCTFIL